VQERNYKVPIAAKDDVTLYEIVHDDDDTRDNHQTMAIESLVRLTNRCSSDEAFCLTRLCDRIKTDRYIAERIPLSL